MAVQALDAALRQNQGTVLFHSCCLDIALAKKLKLLLTRLSGTHKYKFAKFAKFALHYFLSAYTRKAICGHLTRTAIQVFIVDPLKMICIRPL